MIGDRIRETSTTTGTGTLDLQGAVTGHVTFGTGIGNGKSCYYVITDGVDWEIGIGTVTTGSPDRLSRDSVIRSTNANAKVSWAAGTRTVFCFPAAQAIAWGGYGIPTAVMTESDGSLYEVTMAPAVMVLRDGLEIAALPDEGNAGATALKANDTAEKSICLADGSALIGGELKTNALAHFKYSSSFDKWVLLNPQASGFNLPTTTGAANVFAATMSPAVTVLRDGMVLRVRAHQSAPSGGGTPTFSPNGLTAKNIVLIDQTTPKSNEIRINRILELMYDGTNDKWILMNPATGGFRRLIEVQIRDAADASKIKVNTTGHASSDTIAAEDNLAKGGSTTSFSLNAGGDNLTILSSALTGTPMKVLTVIVSANSYGQEVKVDGNTTGGLSLFFRDLTNNIVDLTTLVDTGIINVKVEYLTDAD